MAAVRAVFTRRNVQYLIDLYTPVAFLSVFSPLALAISAPDLAINLLSTHEPMHFVEKYHYVAPLLPGIMISAILGVAWLSRQIARLTKLPRHTVVLALTGIVLASTLYYHHYHGYTPLARAFESYQVTSHHRVGEAIARSIPIEAAVSAQPNLNPHVSGRKTLYRFPYIGDAEYIFLDVSSLANKSDQYGLIRDLLAGDEFGLVRAEDGYLLLRRGAPARRCRRRSANTQWFRRRRTARCSTSRSIAPTSCSATPCGSSASISSTGAIRRCRRPRSASSSTGRR